MKRNTLCWMEILALNLLLLAQLHFLPVHSFTRVHLQYQYHGTSKNHVSSLFTIVTDNNVDVDVDVKAINKALNALKMKKKKGKNKKKNDISVRRIIKEDKVNSSSSGNRPDAMIARAAVLRQTILKQQLELQSLERQIVCCSKSSSSSSSSILNEKEDVMELLMDVASQSKATFSNSLNVLLRKLNRVRYQVSPKNKQYKSVNEFIKSQTITGMRILQGLATNPESIKQALVDPNTPSLIPHIPSIYARLDQLENHVYPILEKVLNNKQHLKSIEPYFDEIMERFDDIEPHLPWILQNIDSLAPYTGLLLNHIDELLLYATIDDSYALPTNTFNSSHVASSSSSSQSLPELRYKLAEQVLPYLEFYVSRLDTVGPHLPLLRPHLPKLLKHNRIAKITPHIDRLFARGYLNLGTSANLDVLLWWVGWTLKIPLVPTIFFAIPGSPRFVTFLANRLPKRFVRGLCSDITCSIDGDYGANWNRLSKD